MRTAFSTTLFCLLFAGSQGQIYAQHMQNPGIITPFLEKTRPFEFYASYYSSLPETWSFGYMPPEVQKAYEMRAFVKATSLCRVHTTIHTFTAKPHEGFQCDNTDKRFDVLYHWQNGYNPTPIIYIENTTLAPLVVDNSKTYTIRGTIIWKTVRVNGCYSNFWNEMRAYLVPSPRAVFIKQTFIPTFSSINTL